MPLTHEHLMFSYNVNFGGTFINQLLLDVCAKNGVSIAELRFGRNQPGVLHLANHRFVYYTEDKIIYKAAGGGYGGEKEVALPRQKTYAIGLVRNPFDWYVGAWSRTCANQPNIHPLYTGVNDIEGFRTWLKHLMNNDNLDLHIGQYLEGLLWTPDEGHPNTYKPSLLQYDFGLLSYQVFALHFGLDHDTWTDSQNINGNMNFMVCNHGRDTTSIIDNIIPVLQNLGLRCPMKGYKLYKYTNPKTQLTSTPHLPYQKYYNDETRELVLYKDRYVFDKYGFKFDLLTEEEKKYLC